MADYAGVDMTNATCAVEDCGRPPLVRGWCNAHYQRVQKFGSPRADVPLRPRKQTRVDEGTCSVEECGRSARWRGWCPPHYERWQRYGNPEGGRAVRGTLSEGPCKVDGCGKPAKGGRGWCKRHYQKYYNTGNPEAPDKHTRRGAPLRERIEARIIKTDHCWFWTAHINAGGYGIINFTGPDGKKTRLAHRASYEAFIGPIPEGMVLDHRCRNRACVRPDHLEPVTHEVNVRRGAATERGTHCGNGHKFTRENTYWVRVCITCSRASRERSKARKAA